MKQKKSSKTIIILIIVALILAICAGLAYAYIATDLFKTNKQLFFKYLTQIGDTENGLIENDLVAYLEKKKNTPYKNDGKFYVNIAVPEEYQSQVQPTNNMDITFNGEVDKNISKAMQNISINYSEDVTLEFIYKQIDSIYGIQTKYVGSKYVAIDTESTSTGSTSSASQLQEGLAEIENVASVDIDKEELKSILTTYRNVIEQELQDSNFGKIEENNEIGYKLSLTGDELKNILVKLLETLKNDQTTLEKINQYSSTSYTTTDIEETIEEINNDTDLGEQKIEVTIYENLGKISKILISVDTVKIEISKYNQGGELQYNISIEQQEEQTIKINLKAKFAGLETVQNINESYELGIETLMEGETYSYQYNFDNNVTFRESSNIEEFNEDNCLDLTKLEDEQANNLITAIKERMTMVNKSQMESLGLDENSNPLINIIPTFLLMGATSNSMTDQINQEEIESFNSKFELYEGTNIRGTTVKGLLTVIATNNGLDDEEEQEGNSSDTWINSQNKLIEEINFNGEEYEVNLQNITIIRGEVLTEDYYRVEFEKDSATGAIYRVVINKK